MTTRRDCFNAILPQRTPAKLLQKRTSKGPLLDGRIRYPETQISKEYNYPCSLARYTNEAKTLRARLKLGPRLEVTT
jgi:hypothetical protein